MRANTATALASPNIALIKYWGNEDDDLRLASNPSISMNLGGLETRTSVTFDPSLSADTLDINGAPAAAAALQRVAAFLDIVRKMSGLPHFASVQSENNFPLGAGVASSASAFAALSLAASTAAGLDLSERDLSRLARRGSGSACRSIPSGFVEWRTGSRDETSYAVSIAPPDHWDLRDLVAVVSLESKPTGSSEGHALASTSPLQAARIQGAAHRLDLCRTAIIARDFDALAPLVELDSNLMHAVMLTSTPPLIYWQPATLTVIHAAAAWRASGLPVCCTIDAGPNVHLLCPASYAAQITRHLADIPGVLQVLTAQPGPGARLISSSFPG